MGGTVTKSGVAVDGKAATDPANGKANGQVSAPEQTRAASTGSHIWHQTPHGSMADKVEEIRLGVCAEQASATVAQDELTTLVQSFIQNEAR